MFNDVLVAQHAARRRPPWAMSIGLVMSSVALALLVVVGARGRARA